jgi:uncharacterized protein YodC (DUF2158 family)
MKFKVGDVVQLKTGGPDMTIEEIVDCYTVNTVWFEKKKLIKQNFEAKDLDLITV